MSHGKDRNKKVRIPQVWNKLSFLSNLLTVRTLSRTSQRMIGSVPFRFPTSLWRSTPRSTSWSTASSETSSSRCSCRSSAGGSPGCRRCTGGWSSGGARWTRFHTGGKIGFFKWSKLFWGLLCNQVCFIEKAWERENQQLWLYYVGFCEDVRRASHIDVCSGRQVSTKNMHTVSRFLSRVFFPPMWHLLQVLSPKKYEVCALCRHERGLLHPGDLQRVAVARDTLQKGPKMQDTFFLADPARRGDQRADRSCRPIFRQCFQTKHIDIRVCFRPMSFLRNIFVLTFRISPWGNSFRKLSKGGEQEGKESSRPS